MGENLKGNEPIKFLGWAKIIGLKSSRVSGIVQKDN